MRRVSDLMETIEHCTEALVCASDKRGYCIDMVFECRATGRRVELGSLPCFDDLHKKIAEDLRKKIRILEDTLKATINKI